MYNMLLLSFYNTITAPFQRALGHQYSLGGHHIKNGNSQVLSGCYEELTLMSSLGYITNTKPSAVFRLRSKANADGVDVDMEKFEDENITAQVSNVMFHS